MSDDDPYVRDGTTGAMMRRSTAEHRAKERAEVAAAAAVDRDWILGEPPKFRVVTIPGGPGLELVARNGPPENVGEIYAALRAGDPVSSVLVAWPNWPLPDDVRRILEEKLGHQTEPAGGVLPGPVQTFLGKVDETIEYVTTPMISGLGPGETLSCHVGEGGRLVVGKPEEDDDFDLFKSALVALRNGATPAAVLSDMLVERPDVPEDIYVILASWMKREQALKDIETTVASAITSTVDHLRTPGFGLDQDGEPVQVIRPTTDAPRLAPVVGMTEPPPPKVCFGETTYTLPKDAEDGAVCTFWRINGRWCLVE